MDQNTVPGVPVEHAAYIYATGYPSVGSLQCSIHVRVAHYE